MTIFIYIQQYVLSMYEKIIHIYKLAVIERTPLHIDNFFLH